MSLCCSVTGYLLNAAFYLGKACEGESEPAADQSETHCTIMSLFEPYKFKNHRVHMDNWFTGIPLISDLKSKGFYVTGTQQRLERQEQQQMERFRDAFQSLQSSNTIERTWGESTCLISTGPTTSWN
jgi:hypothetical protein